MALKRASITSKAGTDHNVNQAHFSPLRKPVKVITKTKNDQLILSKPICPYTKTTKFAAKGQSRLLKTSRAQGTKAALLPPNPKQAQRKAQPWF